MRTPLLAGLACTVLSLVVLVAEGNDDIHKDASDVWFNFTVTWEGGSKPCPELACKSGAFHRGHYACSGSRGGRWNNGVQNFTDPVPPGYLVVGAFVTLVGSFHCNIDSPNASVQVSIDNLSLRSKELPVKPFDGCLCPNCVDTFVWDTFTVNSGWPTYIYGGTNTLAVVVENSNQQEICLSEAIVHLNAQRIVPEPQTITPSSAPLTGGTKVIVKGLYYRIDVDYRCRFGNKYPTPSFAEFLNETHVACTVPAAANASLVEVRIEPSLPSSSAPINLWSVPFQYYEQPTLLAVFPNQSTGDTNVTVIGSRFSRVNDTLICRFGTEISVGWYLNESAILCQVPNLLNETTISRELNLAVALNGLDFTPTTLKFLYLGLNSPSELNNGLPWPTLWWIIGAGAGIIIIMIVVLLAIYLRQRHKRKRYITIPDDDTLIPPQDVAIDPNEIKIHERIGRGSFGDIYRGQWRGLVVAVKRIAYNKMNSKFIRELWKEAKLMMRMRHPNMIQLIGVCATPPEISIVMEYMARGSLYNVLHNPSIPLSWELRQKMALDAARGMNYLHCSNPIVMHRDLKSHNLLVDEGWRVKVSDFGLSRMLEDALVTTMTVCGTPCWTAPEVLRNQKYSGEMCTRQDPYGGLPPFQVVVQVATKGLRPEIPHDCPPEWAQLMVDCWAENEAARPTFAEIIERLSNMDLSRWDQKPAGPPPSMPIQ